ncbi:glutathione S-transferase [Comamonas serinivorans]|uniref:Glutathione S-transferase n=1 Tax=Comamonas serinivorans TaxID=1082851 RepID=A0A1Y0EQ12_9BURK|nr:glutathione S-transferase family protein [Comamonas serinivorans]ARU05744.1 glutathione S-transferase [Comamonas serinivorans]
MLELVIGNKNYSSWSMRPWVVLTQAAIPFTERKLRFDGFEPDSAFKRAITAIHPAGCVPVLIDGPLVIADTLAICEYLAEQFPDRQLWPAESAARAQARSAVAQMHSGFGGLRSALPMNIEAQLPEVGARLLASDERLRADLARLFGLWRSLLERSGGPLLFGAFSVADAFYAPVVMRLLSYGVPVPDDLRGYVQAVQQQPGVQAWVRDALSEHDFIAFEEPYRQAPAKA